MSMMEEHRARTRRSFTDEFKRDAVAMVLDDANKIVGADLRRENARLRMERDLLKRAPAFWVKESGQ